MVTRLYVDNFRCLVNFELKLDETNVLLGPNGSGKTSVLDTLRRIQNLVARGSRIEDEFPTSDISLIQDRDIQHIELDLDVDSRSYRYALRIQHDPRRRRMRIGEETLEHDGKPIFSSRDGTAQLYRDDYAKGPSYPFDWSRSGVGALTASSSGSSRQRPPPSSATFQSCRSVALPATRRSRERSACLTGSPPP